jgi:hypothetical protein
MMQILVIHSNRLPVALVRVLRRQFVRIFYVSHILLFTLQHFMENGGNSEFIPVEVLRIRWLFCIDIV